MISGPTTDVWVDGAGHVEQVELVRRPLGGWTVIRFDLASAREAAASGGKQFRPALGYVAQARLLAEPTNVADIVDEVTGYVEADLRRRSSVTVEATQKGVDATLFAAVFGVAQMLVVARAVEDALGAMKDGRNFNLRRGRPGCYVVASSIADAWQVRPRPTGSTIDLFMRDAVETLSVLQASMFHHNGSLYSQYSQYEGVWELERNIRRGTEAARSGAKRSVEPFTWFRMRDSWAQQVEAVLYYQLLMNGHFLDGAQPSARNADGSVDLARLRVLSFEALSGVELAAHHRPSQLNGALGMDRVGGRRWRERRPTHEPRLVKGSAVPLGVDGMIEMPENTWTMCVGFNHVPVPAPLGDLVGLAGALGEGCTAGSRSTTSPIELLGAWVGLTSLEMLSSGRVDRNGERVSGESPMTGPAGMPGAPRMHSFPGYGALAPALG